MLKIEFEREEDGRWIAEVPALPGVLAYGNTEARRGRTPYQINGASRDRGSSRFLRKRAICSPHEELGGDKGGVRAAGAPPNRLEAQAHCKAILRTGRATFVHAGCVIRRLISVSKPRYRRASTLSRGAISQKPPINCVNSSNEQWPILNLPFATRKSQAFEEAIFFTDDFLSSEEFSAIAAWCLTTSHPSNFPGNSRSFG
jgi:hypothetical protein